MTDLAPFYPGDIVRDIKSVKNVTVLGPGLKRNPQEPSTLRVTRPGRLRFRGPNIYWIDAVPKHYIPKRGDLVVGIVTKKSGDTLKIDIGAAEQASLSLMAFEGATKKQKPDLNVGDVVYGKLLNAHKEMEPEMVCVDSYFKAGKMGPLTNDGFVFGASLGLVVRLLAPDNPLLAALGKKLTYEIAIGMNGRVWVNGKSVKDIMGVVDCLKAAEGQSDATIADICRRIR